MRVARCKLLVASILTAYVFPIEANAADAAHWQVSPEKSAIEWTATYGGKPVGGSFPAFTAYITFDADHLDMSHATIKIETAKVKSGDKDAQENLPAPDWFSAVKFPLATFESISFTHVKDDQYEAAGNLTIRDKTVKVTLPFTLKRDGDHADIKGETTLKRTAFGLGQGDWAQTDTIADDVKVSIHLDAKQVK